MIRSARAAVNGASRHLGSVLVAVLLAPVLPDMLVELFGADEPAWRDPALRVAALGLVIVSCLVVFLVQRRAANRRSHGVALTGIGTCEVLVLPVGFTCVYRTPGGRTGRRSIPEWLVDTCRPQVVLVVASPQVDDVRRKLGDGLVADGIRFECVVLPDVSDPRSAVPDAERIVPERLTALGVVGRRTYVDTTGGNVIMSLAMLRVGSVLGAECTYLASEFDRGHLVPGTQKGRAFDPAALFGGA